MYRSAVSRNTLPVLKGRLPLLSRSIGKNLVRRGYSSSSHGDASYQSNKLLNWSLGATAVLSAIYFISPYEKKPTKKAEEEVKEPNAEPNAEPPAAPPAESQDEPQDESHAESQAESQDEAEAAPQDEAEAAPQDQSEKQQDKDASEENSEGKDLQEPSKENTITSTESHKPEKGIKTDEELQALEEKELSPTDKEAQQEGAYNPDTGEINWDCPCLGGMAQGPCGEEFKAAFSCFVYSEAEPKGIDCVEKFQMMQDCFRKYPDYYADQIKDEEEAASVNASDAPAASSADATKGKSTGKAQLVPADEEQQGQNSNNSSSKEDAKPEAKAPSNEESTETSAKEHSE